MLGVGAAIHLQRADVGIGPYTACKPGSFPQPQRPPRKAAARHGRAMRALRRKQRDCAKKLPCAKSNPCSEAVRAAFVKTPVAVTANRFYWPARSREGAGSMGRDSPVERNCLRNASPWDARRAAQGSPGAAAPGAFWGLFRGEKSPAGGQGKGCRHASAAPAAETADATLAADSRPYGGGASDAGISGRYGTVLQPLSLAARASSPYTGEPSLRHPALCGRRWCIRHGGLRADVGIGPYALASARVHSIRFKYCPV